MKPAAYKGGTFWRAAVLDAKDNADVALLMTAHMFGSEELALLFARRWIANPSAREFLRLVGRGDVQNQKVALIYAVSKLAPLPEEDTQ